GALLGGAARRAPQRTAARRSGIALALGAALLLGGCTPSPTSSYTDGSGQRVTVDWADYPAAAWIDAQAVLDGPTVEQTEEASARLFAEVQDALEEEFGDEFGPFEWSSRDSDGDESDDWLPMLGNGYGGESMLITYNSPTRESPAAIPETEWQRVIDTVAEVAARHGLDHRQEYDVDEGAVEWERSETMLRGDAEWLDVNVRDATLDDEASAEMRQSGWLVSGISLFYGISTIREQDRAEFAERAAPFGGLDIPDATHSD
ncbi:MAG: LppA family lipoprotein, partial [Leucobacter sp.]